MKDIVQSPHSRWSIAHVEIFLTWKAAKTDEKRYSLCRNFLFCLFHVFLLVSFFSFYTLVCVVFLALLTVIHVA